MAFALALAYDVDRLRDAFWVERVPASLMGFDGVAFRADDWCFGASGMALGYVSVF